MSDDEIINPDTVQKPSEHNFQKDLEYYRQTLHFLGANVPIGVLCLPKAIEKVLARNNILRVYDLIGLDLTEIKGLGPARTSLLASRLDEFFFISL